MAESEQQERVPSLAEQWSLQDKDEQAEHGNITKETAELEVQVPVGSEEVDAEKVDQKPVAKETAIYSEINIETPELEVQQTQEVKESQKAEDCFPAKEHRGNTEQVSESTQLEGKEETNENTPITNSENLDQQKIQMQVFEEAQEDVEVAPTIKLETAPADFRFPTTNQTRHCFTRYIEYHRCIAAKGDDAAECQKFAKYYRSLCPDEWIERWNEQRENGTFPGPL